MSAVPGIVERLIAWKESASAVSVPGLGFFTSQTLPAERRIQQSLVELEAYLHVLESLSPRNVSVEIGLDWGGTHFLWTQLFDEVFSIDSNYWSCCKGVVEFPAKSSQINYGDSRDAVTVRLLAEILDGRRVDHLFIDGSHEYSAVLTDFLNYAPFVRSGGMIGFHDAQWSEADVRHFLHDLRNGKISGWGPVELTEIYYGQEDYATGISYFLQP